MQHMGLKQAAIGNTLGEHIGKLMGTHGELERNMLGTKEKWKRSFPPTQNLKENKIKALWVHAEPSHWLHEISMFQNCSSPLL
jgi:hypothetical protein